MTANSNPSVTTAQIHESLADLVGQVTRTKERIIIASQGEKVAALVPFDDLWLLEALDMWDIEKAMEEWQQSGELKAFFEQALKELQELG